MIQVVTFGEIMLRLNPPGFQRFIQANTFEISYGGAEASVAITLATLGMQSSFVTCLPPNEIGQAAINYVRRFGVDTSLVIRSGERIGVYFLEIGANQRPSKVIYDRARSALSEVRPGSIPWDQILSGASWFHFTGITTALSQNAADVCLEAVRSAKKKSLTVSCDLNYRSKLWKYGKTPQEIMTELMRNVDIVCGNEEDYEKMFGIRGANVKVADEVSPERYSEVVGKLIERFPNLKKVAVTLRGSISASHNTWSAMLYDGRKFYTTKKYDIINVVDRLGSGDAFTGAMIYCLLSGKNDQETLDFATAASALKHSILFDPNLVTIEEIESLVKEGGAGRVQR